MLYLSPERKAIDLRGLIGWKLERGQQLGTLVRTTLTTEVFGEGLLLSFLCNSANGAEHVKGLVTFCELPQFLLDSAEVTRQCQLCQLPINLTLLIRPVGLRLLGHTLCRVVIT